MISVKLEGADQFNKAVLRLRKRLPEMSASKISTMAKETKEWLQAQIRSGDLGLPPNLPSTVAKKGSGVPLVDTDAYVSSFMVEKTGPKQYLLRAGDGFELLSKWLEFGTSRMVARSHFARAQAQVDDVIGPNAARELLREAAEELK